MSIWKTKLELTSEEILTLKMLKERLAKEASQCRWANGLSRYPQFTDEAREAQKLLPIMEKILADQEN